ncbi:MAG: efflux RND transporter periplasmic adaptor subunit [Chlamydiales bacterium]|nr:efflux RND transporter periplasmic adaptor subunit [Chlamydiia bacterium]MCP5507350.1 efflux RND transporter periplasmic adaptor subunit [Chlamydiales bacterium]
MSKKYVIFPIIGGIALLSLIFFRPHVSHNNDTIKISGNIEITEVEVSFKIPGRVDKRLVSEGEFVGIGQNVAHLDHRELSQEVAVHEAEVQAAQAQLQEMEVGYLPEEIAQAEAKVRQAEADFNRYLADYERQKKLFENEVISSREFDMSKSAYEVAKAKQTGAKEQLALLQRGIRKEKIDQARAQLEKAKQGLGLAQTKLSNANLTSPITGYVLSENIQQGEFVAPGTPIVTIGNLNDVWMRGYINERDLGKVRLGQHVDVTSDSYPEKIYDGTITFISPEAEFTPKNVQTEQERVKLVYRIKVSINNPNQELKPGMPVDGVIDLNDEK